MEFYLIEVIFTTSVKGILVTAWQNSNLKIFSRGSLHDTINENLIMLSQPILKLMFYF